MIDASDAFSEGWWFKRLLTELRTRVARYDLLDRYMRGDAPLPPGPKQHENAYRWLQKKARANWASLIVEALVERMTVAGFRTAASDIEGDSEAWAMWQANNLDADSRLVHRTKAALGDAYVIVGDVPAGGRYPLITAEDPRQVVVAKDPTNRRRVVAALKVFADDAAGVERAYLYLPGVVHRAERELNESSLARARGDATLAGWEWVSSDRLPVQAVPVVHFPNRADLYGRTLGEFEDVTDELDRLNIGLLQRLSVAINQAFRQRAVKGNLPTHDENGNPIDWSKELELGFATMWSLPADIEIWESAGVDLTPLLESVKADARDLAAVTRTPMFYLFPDAANGSAEGASLQREGLIFKAKDRIAETSDPWEQTIALGFEWMGDLERADRTKIEVIWLPPERSSLAEQHDANIKAKAGDVPWRTRMQTILQYTPAELDRMEQERVREFATDPMTLIMDEIQRAQVPGDVQAAINPRSAPDGVES